MKVQISDLQEFQEELKAERPHIDRSLIRATKLFIPTKLSPNIRLVHVVAGAWIWAPVDVGLSIPPEYLAELRVFCGQHWCPEFPASQETLDRADTIIKALDVWAQEYHLQVRPGMFCLYGPDR